MGLAFNENTYTSSVRKMKVYQWVAGPFFGDISTSPGCNWDAFDTRWSVYGSLDLNFLI